MSLRIRQIVVAATDLDATVEQFESVLGLRVCYRDPEVAHFGLRNALMPIGDQFLEVVSPIRDHTPAGRHIQRQGDSAYMLILQTDSLELDRARIQRMDVRLIWQATYPDISAFHLHPKDIGAAIVSIDQPIPAASWRWAGPDWSRYSIHGGAQSVLESTMASRDPRALSQRWSDVLGTIKPVENDGVLRIDIAGGALKFEMSSTADCIRAFALEIAQPLAAIDVARGHGLPVTGNAVTICGTRFTLNQPRTTTDRHW